MHKLSIWLATFIFVANQKLCIRIVCVNFSNWNLEKTFRTFSGKCFVQLILIVHLFPEAICDRTKHSGHLGRWKTRFAPTEILERWMWTCSIKNQRWKSNNQMFEKTGQCILPIDLFWSVQEKRNPTSQKGHLSPRMSTFVYFCITRGRNSHLCTFQ